jgi:hypothetical protein
MTSSRLARPTLCAQARREKHQESVGMSAIVYEIHVEGVVDETSLGDLGDVTVSTQSATTVLAGAVADQAALLGVLSRLRAQGLVITELHRHRSGDRSSESG